MGKAFLSKSYWNHSQKIESFTLFKPGLLHMQSHVTFDCSIKSPNGDLL